jgi:hypothetical protein
MPRRRCTPQWSGSAVSTCSSTTPPTSADYDERRAKQLDFWKSQNGQQSGDPAKLARALLTIASQDPPPRRFVAGADAVATAEQVAADLKAQAEACRDLSTSLAFDEPAGRAM